MCIEIYSPNSPIRIPYVHELLRFIGPREFEVRYCFLLSNLGAQPLNRLCCLYPRSLFDVPSPLPLTIANLLGDRLLDVTDRLPTFLDGFESPAPGTGVYLQPDPNEPYRNRPPLEGAWLPGQTQWGVPRDRQGTIQADHISALRRGQLTAWLTIVDPPIPTNGSRWFAWRVHVNGQGVAIPRTVLRRPLVLHEVASPIDVRRTFIHHFESALRAAQDDPQAPDWEQKLYQDVLRLYGLRSPRNVDTEYYELVVEPGDPSKRLIVSWQMDRDLRMRTDSPRLEKPPDGRLVYEWKSGSMLRPRHPWTNKGFVLQLLLAH